MDIEARDRMGKIRITRQDLKRDELKDFGTNIYETYERHRMTIWITLGVIVLLWITVKVWGAYRENKSKETNQYLALSVYLFQRGLLSEKQEEREELLKQAAAQCDLMRSRHPGSQAARQALLVKGNALFCLNLPEAAIREFTEFRETANDPEERAQALIALGYCYENQFFNSELKDLNAGMQAMDSYTQAARTAGDSFLKCQALLGQARLMEVLSNPGDAIKIYEQIIAETQSAQKLDRDKFGDDREEKKALAQRLLPGISDVFNSESVAKIQIERIQAVIKGGNVAAAKGMAVPPSSAPAEQTASAPAAAGETPEAAGEASPTAAPSVPAPVGAPTPPAPGEPSSAPEAVAAPAATPAAGR